MKILFTSDIHASDTHLFSMFSVAQRENVDGIFIGGDLVPHNLPNSFGDEPIKAQAEYIENVFIPALSQFKQKHDAAIYLDLGNDDFICNRTILEKHDQTLLKLLHLRVSRVTEDVDVIGYMCVPPTPFTRKDLEKPDSNVQPSAPGNKIVLNGYTSTRGTLEKMVLNLESDDTIENDLAELSRKIDRPFVFVSHSPPHGTALDILYNGAHAGSVAIRDFVQRWAIESKLIASFHGHIHESPVRSGAIVTELGGSLCLNPGQGNGMGSPFRYVVFRLEGDRVLCKSDILSAK